MGDPQGPAATKEHAPVGMRKSPECCRTEPGPGESLRQSISPVPLQDTEADGSPPDLHWLDKDPVHECENQQVPESMDCSRAGGLAGLLALPNPFQLHD